MFALKPGHRARAPQAGAGLAGFSAAGEGFVLPRWLRRPARFLSRLGSGDMRPPRFANAALNVAVLAGAVVYGTVTGGHMPAVSQPSTGSG